MRTSFSPHKNASIDNRMAKNGHNAVENRPVKIKSLNGKNVIFDYFSTKNGIFSQKLVKNDILTIKRVKIRTKTRKNTY